MAAKVVQVNSTIARQISLMEGIAFQTKILGLAHVSDDHASTIQGVYFKQEKHHMVF